MDRRNRANSGALGSQKGSLEYMAQGCEQLVADCHSSRRIALLLFLVRRHPIGNGNYYWYYLLKGGPNSKRREGTGEGE